MRLKVIDYEAMRAAFDEKFKKTMQLIEDGETHLDNLAEGFHEADGVIWSLPTIDAVLVVRCKDCIYSGDAKENEKGFLICPASGMEIMDDDFCSYGERKENTDDKGL